MKNLTPEVIKQLALAQLLADQSEDQGTEFEDGTYEQGVRDALGWMCGLLDNPPYNPDEWPVTEEELAIMTEGLGLVGLTDVDMPSGRKVVDPNNPVAQLMRTVESALNDEEMERACKTMGPTCLGCPDCGPVMGDATYEAMFGKQQDGV